MALLLPSLQGGLSSTKSATTFDCVIETEVVCAALRTVFQGSSFLRFSLLVEIRPAMPSSKKEGRTELKEQEPWHWNNQSQISFIERGAAWISRHYQVCSCLVWVCLHSLGCCENLDHQWIKTTFSSLSSWKTEVQNGCHKAKWFFLEVLAGLGVSEALGKNISLPCPALKATYTAQLADLFSQHPQSFSSGLLTGPLFCSSPYSVDAFAMDLVLPRSFQLPPHFKVSW